MTIPIKCAALFGAITGVLISGGAREASACGCFIMPDPSVPVVQAGERIVFAIANSEVTAHIQIQYQGDAKEFGWLLPLPSLPTLELGTDELFAQLIATTQPAYQVSQVFPQGCASRGGLGAPDLGAVFSSDDGGAAMPSPLVVQDSIGPYDYAVLKADSKDAMLQWLKDNRYFVPVGTDASVVPYIHPGAYFLALKLRSGKSAGDIQPVVVRYASDLPMIPIVLTSVGAQPDMGILVWLLGQGRAIPRNYYHTVLNDAAINWLSGGSNYNDVVIRATKEADKRHTFVTEYAGPSKPMLNRLDFPNRFGDADVLARTTDAVQYVRYLQNTGYNLGVGLVIAILEQYIPFPAALQNQGIGPGTFYANLDYFLGPYRQQYPNDFAGLDYNFDAKALTDELQTRIVKPTLAAGKLFRDFPYMTRLYTTLSPEDMSADPVFSFNPALPDVSNVHVAVETLVCNRTASSGYDGRIRTEQGFVLYVPGGISQPRLPTMPASLRIEMLREMGPPEVVKNNSAIVHAALAPYEENNGASQSAACSVQSRSSRGGLLMLVTMAAGAGLVVWRGRRRRRG